MPDKEREQFYFKQLQRCLPELANAKAFHCESPDYLLETSAGMLGIELTAFHLPSSSGERPHQEMVSLKKQVVEHAQQLHAAQEGPALYVMVQFGRHGRLAKRTVRPIAEALKTALLSYPMPSSSREPSVQLPRHLLPPEIASVHVTGSVDGVDRLWQTDEGAWVAPITHEDVQREITKKERTAYLARIKCDELWLVIAHDLMRGAPSDLADEAKVGEYEHSFDKILWLEVHEPSVLSIG